MATTLLILRATQLLTPSLGQTFATQVAIGLYTAYNFAATIASLPAGRLSDRWEAAGVLTVGVFLFLVALVPGHTLLLHIEHWIRVLFPAERKE